MKHRRVIFTVAAAAIAAAFIVAALLSVRGIRESVIAARVEHNIRSRIAILDKGMQTALEGDAVWFDIPDLPQDLVIYKYIDDTLKAWAGQFPIINDDISSGIEIGRIVHPRNRISTPLADVTDEASYLNLGTKWYVAKRMTSGPVTVIGGLEILNSYGKGPRRGINPELRVPESYSLKPLTESEGRLISVEDRPVLILASDSTPGDSRSMSPFFSPLLYSGGGLLNSLGSMIILNLVILAAAIALFLARKKLRAAAGEGRGRIILNAGVIAGIVAIVLYTFFALASIITNSTIPLELYKLWELTPFSGIVYVSFLTMLLSIPLLLQIVRPMSSLDKILFCLVMAAGIVVVTYSLGSRREENRLAVLADRLSVDRDLKFEMRLMRSESRIASDLFIPALAQVEGADAGIQNRLAEMHLARIAQSYDIYVRVIDSREDSIWCARRLEGGELISGRSRFVFVSTGAGRGRYDAIFSYSTPQADVSMLVELESRASLESHGYARILDLNAPMEGSVPARYSYARYFRRELRLFKGDCAYPTTLGEPFENHIPPAGETAHFSGDGYKHFINVMDDDEVVIISRHATRMFGFIIAGTFIAVFLYLLTLLATLWESGHHYDVRRGSYKMRIRLMVMTSLVLTLVTMATISVLFVYQRNEQSNRKLLTGRINSIQSLLGARIKGVSSTDDLRSQEIRSLLEIVGEDVGSDITLYDPEGRAFMSTAPEVFNRMYLGSRMDAVAYRHIVHEARRYFFRREHLGRVSYYGLYAPLMGEDSRIAAIISSPYTDDAYDFREDAVTHLVAILTIFLILLLTVRFVTDLILERMFKPLSEMSARMASMDLDTLEHIEYDRNDEISALVESYNRMVDDLAESSARLAQAERDKAWSGMARQVAHEIKNPLTPMKLQIQRLVRLKSKGDPSWQDKFDEVSKVLLDHIDILDETAGEFSTFSKLYTEEPTEIDLDTVLQEEISMFDSKTGVHFDYFGLAGARISGPKPQLIRVFVNLINNAVQSLSGREDGRIVVSLRNSSAGDGWYDIVFEDNGDGVAAENVPKLFMPNFTTKNGGSGLGLAISRSILERCGATISYSRSFTLGGACFTIRYPR